MSDLGRIIAVLFFVFTVNAAQLFYRTGFEAENEVFGNFAGGRIPLLGINPGTRIVSDCFRSGRQCITPGPGDGRYGNIFKKSLDGFPGSGDIWLDYYVMTKDDGASGYKSFLYIDGTSGGRIVDMIFYGNKILVNGSILPVNLSSSEWHNIKVHIDFSLHEYVLLVDGSEKGSFKFKTSAPVNALSSVIFGGGASSSKLTYYDDIYVADSPKQAETGFSVVLPEVPALPYLSVNKALKAPAIDGLVDDDCWKYSSVATPFLKLGGTLAEQQTKAYICYDDKYLYLAFKCFDIYLDPVLNQLEKIKGEKTERDSSVFSDDSVELFLGTSTVSSGKYYHIAVNCKGVVYDSALPEPGLSWNPEIITAVSRNEKSWDVEMRIPLESLSERPVGEGDAWRINLCRNQISKSEISAWAPTFGSFHSPSRFGMIRFVNALPAVNDLSMPKELSSGNNTMAFDISAQIRTSLVFSNSAEYDNSETIRSRSSFEPPPGKLFKHKEDITVFPGDGYRNGARRCFISYSIFDPLHKEYLYVSPRIEYSLAGYTPFQTNLIAESSGVYFNYTKDICIGEGQALHRMLLVQCADDIAGKFKAFRYVVDVPRALKLLDPFGNAAAFKEEQYIKAGTERSRYILNIPEKFIYPMKKMGLENRYLNKISLVFYSEKQVSDPQRDEIAMHSEATVDGKVLAEAPVKIPLTLVPAVKGKAPSRYLLISSFGNYNLSIAKLPDDAASKCLDNIARAGFNVFSICDFNNNIFSEKHLEMVRKKIPKTEKAFFLQHKPYLKSFLPDQELFLKQYPEYKAVLQNGTSSPHMVSMEHLLDDNGRYRLLLKKHFADAAKKYDVILWDNENNPLAPSASCYSEASLESFRKFASIKEKVMRQDVISKYHTEWIKFQCLRNARLAKIIYDIIKASNPDCLFNIYSGYDGVSESHYGTSWSLMAPSIDYAECGYGRPLAEINNTMKSISPKKLVSGELIMTWTGDSGYDFDQFKQRIFKLLCDANGGLLVFYDLQVDARFWNTMGALSGLVSDYESFFLEHMRAEPLLVPENGFSKDDYAVLKNASGERLIFLFNQSGTEKEFIFKNLDLPAEPCALDYYENTKLSAPESMSIKVKGLDVKVIVVKSKR